MASFARGEAVIGVRDESSCRRLAARRSTGRRILGASSSVCAGGALMGGWIRGSTRSSAQAKTEKTVAGLFGHASSVPHITTPDQFDRSGRRPGRHESNCWQTLIFFCSSVDSSDGGKGVHSWTEI